MAIPPKQVSNSSPGMKAYQGQAGGKNTAYTMQRRLASSKVHEFDLVSNFDKQGYRNREDITILPPGVLVIGSYNVLTNVSGRIGVTKGYTLDGQSNSTLAKITSSYDFTKLESNDRHVRTWSDRFEFRYVNPSTNIVSWINIYSGINSDHTVNYASFWSLTELTTQLLFVDGTSFIKLWNGAVASYASATSNTITKSGTSTWEEDGFDIPAAYITSTLTFTADAAGGGTIVDSDANFISEGFALGDIIVISGTSSNNGTFTIIGIDAGTITVGVDETITNETPSSATLTFIPSIVISGTTYTYTGGTGTTTITGVSPDPTGAAYAVGTAMAQSVVIYANSKIKGINPDFQNDLIANLDNQVFLGSTISTVIYTSNVNDFLDYSFGTISNGVRLQGEGYNATIAGYPTAFINQEDNLYVSAGKDLWYKTELVNTTTSVPDGSGGAITTIYQTLQYQQLKTTALQAAQSQYATTKIKNDIVYLSFEPIINSLGRVEDILITPQITDLSYSIVNDMNRYDWTDASMIYFRQFLYVSVPKESLIRIYNMTQPKTHYWEAPVTYPIGRFSIINDQLYGHGYTVPETYKLFTGYTFNNAAIPAAAYFSYVQYGTRGYPKDFNLFYLEGYITSNCILIYGLNFDIDGCQTQRMYNISDRDNTTNRKLVCNMLPDASLGKISLGKRPLSGLTESGNIATSTNTGLPPKFRAIKQLSKFPFYELQVFFESLGKDQQWELLAFGPAAGPATEGNNPIQY